MNPNPILTVSVHPVTFKELKEEFNFIGTPNTCIGLAKSTKERCQKPRAHTDGLNANVLCLRSGDCFLTLKRIAELCLCKLELHQDQSDDIAKRWLAEIQLNKYKQVERARDQFASAPTSSTSTPANYPTRSSDSTPIRSRTNSPSITPAGSPVSTPSTPARSAASTPSTTPGNSPLHFTTSRSDSAKLACLETQLQSAQKSIATMLGQNDEQLDQLRICSGQKNEILSENEVLRGKLEAGEEATRKQLQALKAELSNLNTAESKNLEIAHQKVEKLKEQNAKLDEDLERCKFNLTVEKQLSNSCRVLKATLKRSLEGESARVQKLNDDIKDLRNLNAELRAQHDDLNAEMRTQHDNLEDQVKASREEIISLQKTEEYLNTKQAGLERCKGLLVDHIAAFRQDFEKETTEFSRTNDKNATLQRDLEIETTKCNRMNDEAAALRQILEKEKTNSSRMNDETAAFRRHPEKATKESSQMRDEITELRRELVEEKTKSSRMESGNAALSQTLEEERTNSRRTKSENVALLRDLEKEVSDSGRVKAETVALRRALEDEENKSRFFTIQANALSKSLLPLVKRNAKLDDLVATLQQEAKECKTERLRADRTRRRTRERERLQKATEEQIEMLELENDLRYQETLDTERRVTEAKRRDILKAETVERARIRAEIWHRVLDRRQARAQLRAERGQWTPYQVVWNKISAMIS